MLFASLKLLKVHGQNKDRWTGRRIVFHKNAAIFLLCQSILLLRHAINKKTNTGTMELNGKMELKKKKPFYCESNG